MALDNCLNEIQIMFYCCFNSLTFLTNYSTKLFEFPSKARGKTNTELREEFILAAGVSQTMQAFTPRHSIASASQMKVSAVFDVVQAEMTV